MYIHFQSSLLSRPPVLGTCTYIFSPVFFPDHRSLGHVRVHTFSVQSSFQTTGPWDKYIHFQSSRLSSPPVLRTATYIFSPVFFLDYRSLGQVHTFSVQSSFQSTSSWDSYIHFQSSRLFSPPVLGASTYRTFPVKSSFESTCPWGRASTYISSQVVFPAHQSLGQVHTFSVQSSHQSTSPWEKYIHFQSSRLSSPPVLRTSTYIFSPVVFPVHRSLGQLHTFSVQLSFQSTGP